jgi:hypothetical protein
MPIKNVALLGAGGKMGLRLTANLRKADYRVRHVEISEAGQAALFRIGIKTVDVADALDGVDAVVLAVPDNLIGKIAHEIEPLLSTGVMVVCLDAAAPYAGDLPEREDLVYFITHPCHPPVVGDEKTPEAQYDFFGGIHAKQHIVCCMTQGPDGAYVEGVRLARTIFAPVMRAHRCTVEQMAILEPVLSETVAATCVCIMKEATDEAVRRGVPKQAAEDFILGHLKVELGIAFELFEGGRFSDGALVAIEKAKKSMFQPNWKDVFEEEAVKQSVRDITQPPSE